MGHPEFEVLFGAQNRNNEVQFRLLFTPLARKQLLALMKDKNMVMAMNLILLKITK